VAQYVEFFAGMRLDDKPSSSRRWRTTELAVQRLRHVEQVPGTSLTATASTSPDSQILVVDQAATCCALAATP